MNLIGEHVDHQGYSVLPIAINKTALAAIGRSSNCDSPLIALRHAKPEKFESYTFSSISDVKIASVPCWANYVIAALLGVIEFKANPDLVGKLVPRHSPLQGLAAVTAQSLLPQQMKIQLLVDGDVPQVRIVKEV